MLCRGRENRHHSRYHGGVSTREAPRLKRGRPPHDDILTPAEWRVVNAVRHGMTNRQIARGRGISLDAVKFHVENAVQKLGLDGRAALRKWRGAPRSSALSKQEGTMTTSKLELGAIGQIARHVADIDKAEAWYRDVLGLTHLYSFPSSIGKLAFFDCGGTRLFLETARGGTPASRASSTSASRTSTPHTRTCRAAAWSSRTRRT